MNLKQCLTMPNNVLHCVWFIIYSIIMAIVSACNKCSKYILSHNIQVIILATITSKELSKFYLQFVADCRKCHKKSSPFFLDFFLFV